MWSSVSTAGVGVVQGDSHVHRLTYRIIKINKIITDNYSVFEYTANCDPHAHFDPRSPHNILIPNHL